MSRVVHGPGLDIGDELEALVKDEGAGMVRESVVLMSRLLASGLIAPRNAAQGLRDIAHDMRVCSLTWASVAAQTAILDAAARLIDRAESARSAA